MRTTGPQRCLLFAMNFHPFFWRKIPVFNLCDSLALSLAGVLYGGAAAWKDGTAGGACRPDRHGSAGQGVCLWPCYSLLIGLIAPVRLTPLFSEEFMRGINRGNRQLSGFFN